MAEANDNQKRQLSADLLGFYLGIADEEARARIEAAFADDDDALTAAQARLHEILKPLNLDEVPAPPPHLVAGILDRVEQARNVIPMRRPAAAARSTKGEAPAEPIRLAADGSRGGRGGPMLALREVVGLAAAILIFVGLFVPGYRNARTVALRNSCADNLRAVGNGYASYAAANNGQLPYAGYIPPGAYWIQPPRGGGPVVRNSQNVFNLVNHRYFGPQVLVCPGRPGDAPMPDHAVGQRNDFPDPRNNSYSPMLWIMPIRAEQLEPGTPVIGDMTPLVDDEHRLVPAGAASLNSDSHGRSAGQNVLYIDLRVEFHRTPYVGLDRDDIYRLFGVEQYTGLERPLLKTDAFLVP